MGYLLRCTFTFQVVRSVIQNNCVRCQNICVWCNIIVLEVSCKYHLTWWIMPFVVAAGIDFTNTWDFIRLFSIYASTSLMMESPTIRVSFRGITFNAFINRFIRCYFLLIVLFIVLDNVVLSVMFFLDDVLFILLNVTLLVVVFKRSFTISVRLSRLCPLLVVKIYSDVEFWL